MKPLLFCIMISLLPQITSASPSVEGAWTSTPQNSSIEQPFAKYHSIILVIEPTKIKKTEMTGLLNSTHELNYKIKGNDFVITTEEGMEYPIHFSINNNKLILCTLKNCETYQKLNEVPEIRKGTYPAPKVSGTATWTWGKDSYTQPIEQYNLDSLFGNNYNPMKENQIVFPSLHLGENMGGAFYHVVVTTYLIGNEPNLTSSYASFLEVYRFTRKDLKLKMIATSSEINFLGIGKTISVSGVEGNIPYRFSFQLQ